jgi:hypothetical protein
MDRPSKPASAECAVFAPSVSLVGEAASRLAPSGADFSGNLVVFPGKRPAHFLRKVIARSVGRSFIPPVIWSIEELVDHVFEAAGPSNTTRIETIDAVAFLFEMHRAMERPVGGGGFLTLEAFFPLGMRIYRDIEELLIEGVSRERLRELEPLIETPLPPRARGGLQSLSAFYDRFHEAIGEAGFSSRSERYVRAGLGVTPEALPFGASYSPVFTPTPRASGASSGSLPRGGTSPSFFTTDRGSPPRFRPWAWSTHPSQRWTTGRAAASTSTRAPTPTARSSR